MNRLTFHITSLGCAKNSVDSASMAQLLEREGYCAARTPQEADVMIVNTCGFIEPARQESYSVLRALAEIKRPGQWLIAAGCLTQRYGMEVAQRVPGVDGILGARRWMDIVTLVRTLRARPASAARAVTCHLPAVETVGRDEAGVLRAALAGTSAYLKIADGCDRPCAFCAIPLIKGPAVSRPLPTLIEEARLLQQRGVRELILIAQDTTAYGQDLGLKDGLVTLLRAILREAPQIDWIRLLYAFPGAVSEGLMELMATEPRLLPYLDMPLQHAHPDTLRRMRRPANMDWVYRTLARMRATIPGLAIRTAFIVGYPGETEAEFQTLLDFVRAMRFDRVGVFLYSFEAGTPAEALGDPIPPEVKEERYQRLMELQQSISLQINQTFVGQRLHVLVEGYSQSGRRRGMELSVGRSYRDAPEIDGLVLIEGRAAIGDIVPVHITDALAYDLIGRLG